MAERGNSLDLVHSHVEGNNAAGAENNGMVYGNGLGTGSSRGDVWGSNGNNRRDRAWGNNGVSNGRDNVDGENNRRGDDNGRDKNNYLVEP
jgi:hypothetical protein